MRFCIFLLLWMEFSVQGNWIPITKRRDGVERLVSEPQTQANYYYKNGKVWTFWELSVIVLPNLQIFITSYKIVEIIFVYCLLKTNASLILIYTFQNIFVCTCTYHKVHWCRNVRRYLTLSHKKPHLIGFALCFW